MADFEIHEPLLLLNVHRTYREDVDVYATSRWAWRLSPDHAGTRLVLMHYSGVVVGVFRPTQWLRATHENGFPVEEPERWGFIGEAASPEIASLYMGRTVPEDYLGRNPVRFVP